MLTNQNQNNLFPEGNSAGNMGEATDSVPSAGADATQAPIHENKAVVIRRILKNIQDSLDKIEQLVASTDINVPDDLRSLPSQLPPLHDESGEGAAGERVIEGVFNGQNMIGQDGKEYTVPPNYASKSKLVEGDLLKLTIDPRGRFIYKQIGPIDKARIVGTLEHDAAKNQYYASVPDGTRWKLLMAPVTYYKGEPGDEAIILVPKNSISQWAAVENIIKKYH